MSRPGALEGAVVLRTIKSSLRARYLYLLPPEADTWFTPGAESMLYRSLLDLEYWTVVRDDGVWRPLPLFLFLFFFINIITHQTYRPINGWRSSR